MPAPRLPDRTERVPPHDLDAEVAVLGSMLLDNDVIGDVANLLRPEDFYRDAHRRLFETMLALYDGGKGCDAVLLREELRRRGELDAAGGSEAILGILERVPTAAHGSHYAQVVRDASVRRGIISAADRVIQSAFDGAVDARTLVDEAESSFFSLDRNGEGGEATPIGTVLREVFYKIDRLQSDRSMLTGLETGFTDLDDLTGGLQPGEMVVVAGRPSMGKTTLTLCLLEHAAVVGGHAVLLFSLEMGRRQIVQNVLCSRAKVDGARLRRGFLADEEYAKLSGALARLGEAKIFIDDSAGLSPLAIRSRARRLKKRHDIRLIVVDYLQLMTGGSSRREENRQQEISFISRSLKALARELEVPLIAVSQLNRGVENRADHRPMMSDLRESGAIEQDADLVLLLHREEYYESDPERKRALSGKADLIVAKHRNGPTDTIPLTFMAPFMRFENGVKEAWRPGQ